MKPTASFRTPPSKPARTCRQFRTISSALACALLGSRVSSQELFARPHAGIPSGHYPGVAGELDGDGDLDFVESGFNVFENVDCGRLVLSHSSSGNHGVDSLVDLNSDGLADLLSKSPVQPGLGVWINPGDGAFQVRSSLAGKRRGVESGDMDADGDVDLFAFAEDAFSAATDVLFLNDGTGDFSNKSPSVPTGTGTEAAYLADFDGNGYLDVLRYGDPGALYLWLNDGGGGLSNSATPPPAPALNYLDFLRVADLDLDGTVDYLIANPPRLYANQGTGTFVDQGPVLPLVSGLQLVDLDQDQAVDALAAPTAISYEFFRNQGNGSFILEHEVLPQNNGVLVADVDTDQDLDFFAVAYPNAHLWLNDGTNHWSNVYPDSWETQTSASWVTLGDIDGDRFPEAIALVVDYGIPFGQNVTAALYVYRSLGTSAFREDKLELAVSQYARSGALIDLDLDGDLDFWFRDGEPRLLVNDGNGRFTDISSSLPNRPVVSTQDAIGDVDFDGDQDLLLIGASFPRPLAGYLWLNDGSGRFSISEGELPSLPYSPDVMVLGDVDGDLDLDAWMASPELGDVLWLSDGRGGFFDASANVPPTLCSSDRGTFLDLDGDGDLDLLASREASYEYPFCFGGTATTFLNDGTGLFTEALGRWPVSYPVRNSLHSADFDEDGDLDVVGGCGLWLNDGSGFLEDESYELPYCYAYSHSSPIQDLDLDGDLDLWFGGFPRPVMNMTRHLSWRPYPRAGKQLTMEVFGPPNSPWKLFAAHDYIAPQATDFGYLRLPASGLRLIRSGNFDSEGQAAVTLGVPSDRALPGTTVYWQALVGDPPRLTNLEFTTFREL